MRLIAKIKNERQAKTFSLFLSKQEIDNICELQVNRDWGSSQYSDKEYLIWIVNEDHVEAAQKHYEEFVANPKEKKFQPPEEHLKHYLIPELKKKAEQLIEETKDKVEIESLKKKRPSTQGIITLYIMIACAALFLYTSMNDKPYVDAPSYFTPIVITSSPLKKQMLYDYPGAYDVLDDLQTLYGLEQLNDPSQLPKEGQFLVQKYLQTRYWKGAYHLVTTNIKRPELSWWYYGPMFEKIQQGEVWRLVTPIFLHGDIFHIFFNMIWLMILGHQIERRVGILKYLLFILICAVVSNTSQYLMSGSAFLGFSGVICGMIGFIYARQKIALWEGYQLQKTTINFISFFILGLAAIAVVSFVMEVTGVGSFPVPVANTAHITGAITGYLLGRLNFFAWTQSA